MEIKKLLELFHAGEKEGKKTGWILVILIGLLLMVIVMPTDRNKGEGGSGESPVEMSERSQGKSDDSWGEKQMEERLEQVLSNIEGVGRVQVMITYKDSGTQIVEKDGGSSSSNTTEEDASGGRRSIMESQREETTVYTTGGDGEPFIARELSPEIEGILVVAEGGDKTSVRQNISNAVLALFPVEAHKIVVVKMNN